LRACGIGLLVVALLLSVVLSRTPSFHISAANPPDTLKATNTLLRNSVPNTQRAGTRKIVSLTPGDLDTIANYAFSRKRLEAYAQSSVKDRRLRMEAVIKMPWQALDLYLNVRLIVDDAEPDAVVQHLKIGHLAVPRPLVGWLLQATAHFGPFARFGQIADEVVRQVRIMDDNVRVEFDWNREALARADDLVTDVALRERMQAYYRSLLEVVTRPEVKRYVRLSSLMQALFAVARDRSVPEGEPVEENRALILVLNAYLNGRDVTAMIGWRRPEVPVPVRQALLNRRVDLAQHFVTSAALAVSGTKTLADVVGLAKEINDTHSGSGFSFTDLAADRAGAHFGKFAVRSVETARKLQNSLSSVTDESLFMPSISDLPEHLKTAEFQQRFKTIDSPEFGELKRMIDERIAACPIYLF
jgi:hypothetical protein